MNDMITNAMREFKSMIDLDKVIDINGRQYKKDGFNPVYEPTVDCLKIHTLTGIVDAVQSDLDQENVEKIHIRVCSPTRVCLETDSFGPYLQRHCIIESTAYVTDFSFGRQYQPEDFVIALLSQFQETEHRDALLKACSAITKASIGTLNDNGISQKMELKQGVALRREVEFKNPVTLQPFRTFAEITQPVSAFVFRVHDDDGVSCSLHEADGSAWKLKAITDIRDYFKNQLPEIPVIA
ncbi:hypothetical protein [uncultured Desulfobacter sp.]|uniref:hypothetical protein n=1 Tax=uncultured Desulfobacter sp. TaxID=240139 RepID=UPI0029F524CC|nr:hypothetical protein [uncultured Desulfobacter sp.]